MTGEILTQTGSITCQNSYSGTLINSYDCQNNLTYIVNEEQVYILMIDFLLTAFFLFLVWKLIIFARILVFGK